MENKGVWKGTPDVVENLERRISITYSDFGDDMISFGFFPIDLNGKYQFFSTRKALHAKLSEMALKTMLGSAYDTTSAEYKHHISSQIYLKGYGVGRAWVTKNIQIVAFWNDPSSNVLSEVQRELNLPSDTIMVCSDDKNPSQDERNLTIKEYIDSNFEMSPTEYSEMNKPWKIDDKYKRIINSNTASKGAFAKQKEKEGWKTMAQRNHILRQESIANIMAQDNILQKLIEDSKGYLKVMNEALDKQDFTTFEVARDILGENIKECSERKELIDEANTTNFFTLNAIFEEQLPTLLKTNKKAVKEVVNFIKESRLLTNEFKAYDFIRKYSQNLHEQTNGKMIDFYKKLIPSDAEKSVVLEENKKLRDIMKSHGIVSDKKISADDMKLYESLNTVFTKKSNSSNIETNMNIAKSHVVLEEYLKERSVIKEMRIKKGIDDIIDDYVSKMDTNLNESEQSMVKTIIDFRSPIAEQRKQAMFEKFRNECVKKINEMLKEDSENTELKELKEKVQSKTYKKESVVEDLAKLLEIRDILLDK